MQVIRIKGTPLTYRPETTYFVLNQVALRLGLQIDRSQIDFDDPKSTGSVDQFLADLRSAGQQVGIRLAEQEVNSLAELQDYLAEGYPVVLVADPDEVFLLNRYDFGKYEVVDFEPTRIRRVRPETLRRRLKKHPDVHVLVGQDELECRSLSTARVRSPAKKSSAGHHHLSPLRRFLAMLNLDRRDMLTVALFAFIASLLALATPLAVESLVNVVSWGVYLQPLLILSLMLLVCLGLGAVMRILQTIMVEVIQRRQFVRIVSDLAHRFPRASRNQLYSVYPRELANRIFDIMTIQKATAVLLFDGISIVLTTLLGLVLLAAYHPYLLGFDLVLLLTMVLIIWGLGRGGIRTAIEESITKYRIAHWLQDVIDSPATFRLNGGESLAIDRANRLTIDYIAARKRQFRVVLRQVVFAVGLQVIASTVLLSLGGWLVITGGLTLGQLVASELVVTVVVGAFAKAGKSLEKYYDLMAGIDKVGHMLDLDIDKRAPVTTPSSEPLAIQWGDLKIQYGLTTVNVPGGDVPVGGRVALLDQGKGGATLLARAMVGLLPPQSGMIHTGGAESMDWNATPEASVVAYAGSPEVFHGSLRENVNLGRPEVGRGRVREVLQAVGLWESVAATDNGADMELQTGGYPLNDVQIKQLMLARAIAGRPRLLVVDQLLDGFEGELLEQLWSLIADPRAMWTLVLSTGRSDLAERCRQIVKVEVAS